MNGGAPQMLQIIYTSTMSDINKRAKIDEIRARLYERGVKPPVRPETHLVDDPVTEVNEVWPDQPQLKESTPVEPTTPDVVAATSARVSMRRRKFRRIVLFSGLCFFFTAVVVSTLVLFFGNNGISANNISISVNGPFTIGGGETMTLQVGVTNANTVPIRAATLIVDYPEGTRKPDSSDSVFVERIPLETIRAGETVNVPVRAVVYGEESSDREIKVSIEYRVEGSNATFFREAEPFRFKISSAPVVLQTQNLERVSAGQETDIIVTVTSNSQSTINDIIVQADYPIDFDYTLSEPSPVRGQNTWRITELAAGEEQSITVRGVFTGQEEDELVINFSVGAAAANDPTEIASVFDTAHATFFIEQPFIDIALELDGQNTDQLIIDPNDTVNGRLTITNTLSDIIYDTEVQLQLGGNALSDPAVSQTDGFYDSLKNIITWGPTSRERLTELRPGESVSLTFSLQPDAAVTQTPTITLSASAESRRVRESRVPEVLTGSVAGTITVATLPTLISEARRIRGPVPPTVDEVTEYTLSMLAETASNNLNNVVVTTVLPPYVEFIEPTSERGTISFSKSNRTVTWTVGNIEVGQPAVGSFTVAFRPSVSQVGETPVLMQTQRLRAEDAFTGSIVRAEQAAVTTEMSTELGFAPGNGRVVE